MFTTRQDADTAGHQWRASMTNPDAWKVEVLGHQVAQGSSTTMAYTARLWSKTANVWADTTGPIVFHARLTTGWRSHTVCSADTPQVAVDLACTAYLEFVEKAQVQARELVVNLCGIPQPGVDRRLCDECDGKGFVNIPKISNAELLAIAAKHPAPPEWLSDEHDETPPETPTAL